MFRTIAVALVLAFAAAAALPLIATPASADYAAGCNRAKPPGATS